MRDPIERARQYIGDVGGYDAGDEEVVQCFDLMGPTARGNFLSQVRDYPKDGDIDPLDAEKEMRRESLLRRLEERNRMLSRYGR